MRILLSFACIILSAMASASPGLAQDKPKVASFGLCADQMTLLLADRAQIALVSDQATGPLSQFSSRARGLRTHRGTAEEVLASGADIFITSSGVDPRSAAALKKFGVRILEVPFANSWDEVEAMTRASAAAIGQRSRGEAILRDMHRRLARVAPSGPRRSWPSVVYYRPDMGGAGASTFVDATLEAAGLRNLQAKWGPPQWVGVPVERVVVEPPDAFIVSYFDTSRNGLSVLRRNPVLWSSARTRPVIQIPGKYWNCGSPLLVNAVERLAKERTQLMEMVR